MFSFVASAVARVRAVPVAAAAAAAATAGLYLSGAAHGSTKLHCRAVPSAGPAAPLAKSWGYGEAMCLLWAEGGSHPWGSIVVVLLSLS